MDKEQFEELIMTLISGFRSISDSIKELSTNINSIDKKPKIEYDEDDYHGIPIHSAHHPNNPDYTTSKLHYWDKTIKMWRKR